MESGDDVSGRTVAASEVRNTFDRITAYYDRMNRVMTLGRHRVWCREVAARARVAAGHSVLDLATGTGDIAFAVRGVCPGARIVGADFSTEMLERARTKPHADTIEWRHADAMDLPFADGEFDCVTHGYLLRNVADVRVALQEQRRVLRPGGKVVVLETCRPTGPLRHVLTLGMKIVIPTLGWLIAHDRESYSYLERSTRGFNTAAEIAEIMREEGFVVSGWVTRFLGTNFILSAERKD